VTQNNCPNTPNAKLVPGICPWDLTRQFSVHGDIQAVFDAEPPAHIEEEIEHDDDLNHTTFEDAFNDELNPDSMKPLRRSSSNKRVNGKDRRDSVAPFAGMVRQKSNVISEDSDEDNERAGDYKKHNEQVQDRLRVLEDTTQRIESLLGKLCAALDDESKVGNKGGKDDDENQEEGSEDMLTLGDIGGSDTRE
jgi:hypothetical protein